MVLYKNHNNNEAEDNRVVRCSYGAQLDELVENVLQYAMFLRQCRWRWLRRNWCRWLLRLCRQLWLTAKYTVRSLHKANKFYGAWSIATCISLY